MAKNAITDVDIWKNMLQFGDGVMASDDAKAILRWKFNDAAKSRMGRLADRNNQGKLTESEKEELESYIRVGQVVAILQAQARLSLQRSSNGHVHGTSHTPSDMP